MTHPAIRDLFHEPNRCLSNSRRADAESGCAHLPLGLDEHRQGLLSDSALAGHFASHQLAALQQSGDPARIPTSCKVFRVLSWPCRERPPWGRSNRTLFHFRLDLIWLAAMLSWPERVPRIRGFLPADRPGVRPGSPNARWTSPLVFLLQYKC